jgi:hypothetical protein
MLSELVRSPHVRRAHVTSQSYPRIKTSSNSERPSVDPLKINAAFAVSELVSEPYLFLQLGLALSEKQMPRIVVNKAIMRKR